MKRRLLEHLRTRSYVRLGVSKIAGVGVFAIRNIPVGTDPFPYFMKPRSKTVKLMKHEVETLPRPVREMVRDFFLPTGETEVHVPAKGLNELDMSFYLNHNNVNPNVQLDDKDSQDGYTPFVTSVPIACGEELTFDYNTGTDFVRIDKAYFKNESAEPVKQHVRGDVTVKS